LEGRTNVPKKGLQGAFVDVGASMQSSWHHYSKDEQLRLKAAAPCCNLAFDLFDQKLFAKGWSGWGY
jgi:hypothetical protein